MTVSLGTTESYIGVFLENILYGVYLSVFVESCLLMWRKQHERKVKHTYLMVTILLLFIFITMCCIMDNVRCIVALNNPGLDLGPPNSVIGILINACWALATGVADAFIIFRTFIVWNKNRFVIILPSLFFLGYVGEFLSFLHPVADYNCDSKGTATWLIVALIKFDLASGSIGDLSHPITAFQALSLCTTLLCTGLISFRIFSIRRNVGGMLSGCSEVMKFVSVLVESAAMYTVLLTASLITNVLRSYVNYILCNCTPPTIGIVFSYIIIRMRRENSYGDSTASAINTRGRESSPTFENSSSRVTHSGMSQVQVRLERVVHQHSDVDVASKHAEPNYDETMGA
ncbi:hypothetical protein C8R44DRAFT_871411 [Mycena epipterygia]|nr:hypothetical protein C8R44DRAFT_871411 [Mycena epipterygia]